MKKKCLLSVLIVIVSVCGTWICLSLRAESDKNSYDEKRSEKNQAIVKERMEKIEKEIETLENHPWAGSYYEGDGLGVNRRLLIAPESGFAFTWHGCLGLYDQNYGKAIWEKDRVKLSFTFENLEEGFQGLENEFIPVRWDERHYLIPPKKMIDFCNHVNSGWYRTGVWGQFLLRDGDEKKKCIEKPDVPEKYRPYLLDQPIEAMVIEVGEVVCDSNECEGECCSPKNEVSITINKGKKDGVLPKMEFYILDNDYPQYSKIKIIEVDESQSKGTKEVGEYTPVPKTGWKISTRSRWADVPKENL